MGYYMCQGPSHFFMKKDDLHKAFEILKTHDDAIRSDHGWVLSSFEELDDVMECYGWLPGYDINGDVNSIDFIGEKYRHDEVILELIAPYVKKGSYIIMFGEDGIIWCWYFDGEKCTEH